MSRELKKHDPLSVGNEVFNGYTGDWVKATDVEDVVPRSRYDAANQDWLDALAQRDQVRDVARVEIDRLTAKLAEVQKQLPEDMQDCTILFKECELGHGWLTATNWVQHDCPTCQLAASEARVAKLEEMNLNQRKIIASQGEQIDSLTARLRGYDQILVRSGPTKYLAVQGANLPIKVPEPETLSRILDKLAALSQDGVPQ